jgi:YesN/AraC family two-component response regulator
MKARTGTQPIRVLIADDHPAIREGLTAIFRSQNDIEVVAEATDGEEACQLYDQLSPDVLLVDLRMPKKDALPAVIELMSSPRAPKPRIIVSGHLTKRAVGASWRFDFRRLPSRPR